MDEIVNENVNVETTDTNYIDEIKNLKQNSVSKGEYEKILNERNQLIQALANGETVQAEEPIIDYSTKKENISKMVDEMNSGKLNNLNYIDHALKVREDILEIDGVDTFLPNGKIALTDEDYRMADKVATMLKECVEYADGDNEAFTNEFQRRLKDVNMPTRKK